MGQVFEHPPGGLKGRKLDCMLLVKEGLSSKEIARELGISHRTVDQHVAAAVEALGAPNRKAAISRLLEMDLEEGRAESEPFMLADPISGGGEEHLIDGKADRQPADILPPLGGAANMASRAERIAWMMRIAVFSIMLTSGCILAILGVVRMATRPG